MALDESFLGELESAVAESVKEPEAESKNEDTGTTTADDVGAEAVNGEAGNTGDASTDGDGATPVTEDSTGAGDGASATPDTGKSPSSATAAISDSALTEAVRHGIPIEDARLFPSEAALSRAVQAVRKSIEQLAPKEEKAAEVEEDLVAKLAGVDLTSFDEDVQAVLTPVLDVIKKQQEQLKALRAQTEQYHSGAEQARNAAAQHEVTAWFDSQVAKLGDGFKDVLGVGGTDALLPTSPQKAKRDAIANQAALLFAGYNATGTAPASRDEVFAQAAKLVLADDYAKIAEKKLTESLQKRSKQHIQRAGGNQKAKAGGDPAELAAEGLRKMFPQLSH